MFIVVVPLLLIPSPFWLLAAVEIEPLLFIVVVPLLRIPPAPVLELEGVVIEPVPVIVSVPEVRVHVELTAVLIVPPLEVHCAIDEV